TVSRKELSVDEIVKERIEQAKKLNLSNDVWYLVEHFFSDLNPSDATVAKESGILFGNRSFDTETESYSIDVSMLNSNLSFKVGNTQKHNLPDDSYEDKTIAVFKDGECVLSF